MSDSVRAALSLLFVRYYPARVAVVLYGIVLMSRVGSCGIFWADPRYCSVSEVTFCVLTALSARSSNS
jgi:hypothetical protein